MLKDVGFCQIAFNCDPPFAFNSDPASVRNDGAETAGAESYTFNRRPKLTVLPHLRMLPAGPLQDVNG